jgi:hypothetical protein
MGRLTVTSIWPSPFQPVITYASSKFHSIKAGTRGRQQCPRPGGRSRGPVWVATRLAHTLARQRPFAYVLSAVRRGGWSIISSRTTDPARAAVRVLATG